jgi:hypothetical protein
MARGPVKLESRIDSRPMTATALRRLHEELCFARAYPQNASQLAAARRGLAGFHRRPDTKRLAEALADTGIAGTPIHYRFFWPTALWLFHRYPSLLTIDWTEREFVERLGAILPLLVSAPEADALRRAGLPAREAIERLRAPRETDAAFLIGRIEALPGGDAIREATHDALDVAYRLVGSATGPSRTHSFFNGAPFAFRTGPPTRSRPSLAKELLVPPRSIHAVGTRDGARLVDLARAAMVTRSRDLDAFAHGDPRDVRLIDDGDGLAFALIGVLPERRLFLPAVYGALTLRNGVPIGYVQLDVLFGNAEVSYNTFETFRGGEAGFVFCRLLAATRHLFGVTNFSIEPYQLGHGNEEGIASGAWWFYARFGFRPRDPKVLRLARVELGKRARDPGYRSDRSSLLRLAQAHVFWSLHGKPGGVVTPTAAIGFALARLRIDGPAAGRFGVRSMSGWTAGERRWWKRWTPLLAAIPALDRWSSEERRALVNVVRAKGGRRESDYARLFDAHPRLANAVLAIPGRPPRMR